MIAADFIGGRYARAGAGTVDAIPAGRCPRGSVRCGVGVVFWSVVRQEHGVARVDPSTR